MSAETFFLQTNTFECHHHLYHKHIIFPLDWIVNISYYTWENFVETIHSSNSIIVETNFLSIHKSHRIRWAIYICSNMRCCKIGWVISCASENYTSRCWMNYVNFAEWTIKLASIFILYFVQSECDLLISLKAFALHSLQFN